MSSPNGILLFREISKVIVGYGSRILTLGDIPKDQLYPLKYPLLSGIFTFDLKVENQGEQGSDSHGPCAQVNSSTRSIPFIVQRWTKFALK